MSKTHKREENSPIGGPMSHEAEYRIIKHDLVKVVILNVVYLAAVLVLYYANQKSHFLEAWFSQMFNF